MELYLIRHAQSLNNALPAEDRVEDAPLTDIGHQQCSHLAKWIPELKTDTYHHQSISAGVADGGPHRAGSESGAGSTHRIARKGRLRCRALA